MIGIKSNGRLRLPATMAQLLLGLVGLALITFVCFRLGIGVARTGFVFVILVALVSLLGSISASIALSIAAAACLNYFFTEPLFDLRIDLPEDVERIVAFLTASLIVGVLTTKVRASEKRFRTFVDNATDAFFVLDEDWTVLDVNRQACDVLGCSREELIGKHKNAFDVGLDDTAIQRLKRRMVSGEALTFETRHRRKDGSSFPVEVRVGPFEQGGRRFLCLVRDITQRKRAEDELRASEERFRSVVDHATDAFFLFDEHQAIVDVNKQASEGLGYSRDEILGMHPGDFDAALDQSLIARVEERVNRGETVTFETLHRRKDGTLFPVEVRARQFQHGSRRFRLSLARDITERKRAEEALRESEAKLQRAQSIAHFGWWERDFTTNHVSLSDEVCRIFGLRPVELPEWHDRWLNLIHPDDRLRVAEAAAAAVLRDGKRFDVEYRVVRPDGIERTVHSQGDVTWDESGQPLRQFGVLQDITELRHAEEDLRESEERFRTLIQFSFDVYWESDAQHRFTRQEFAKGLVDAPAADSEIGKTRWEVPYLEPHAEAWRKHRETLDAYLPFRDFELARPGPDGGKRYVSVSGLPIFDKSGHFVGYRGVGRHITERKKAEEALRRSEAYLAEAQRLSHTGTIVFNEAGPVYWSKESYEIWDLDPKKGLPSLEAVLQRIHPDDREASEKKAFDALRQIREYAGEFRIVLPGGTTKYLETRGHPSMSMDGTHEMIVTHIDVTERKRAEAEHERLRQLESELAHMNRLSIMGELTASLAHEMLHPIATARNNARSALRFLDMTPVALGEIREALECVVRDADRGKDIVSRIREHVKKAPPRKQRFDINEAIREVIEMVQTAIDKNKVSVSTHFMESLLPVVGDRVQVQQVVLNLIMNAMEAMSSVQRERKLLIKTEQDKAGILIAVCDSGPGINPEQLDRVFEPFYTTKTSGVGMGLSICRSIVAAHGGRLWVDADRGGGATFQFTVPAAQEGS